ncbi:MAG: hypothetical protein HYR67_02550 [Bacteroidetes bacterium]|nr:hypothetical protein [Bacteroidota bacterium]
MKKSLYSLLAVGLVVVYACNSKSSDTAQKSEPLILSGGATSLYAVPLDTAVKNIKHYDKNIKMYDSLIAAAQGKKPDKKIPIKAFTIRAADLFEAMGMSAADTVKATYKYVRVYLAMNHKNDFKMYLTPVDGANLSANPPVAGKDVIMTGKYNGLSSDGSYVLDFTQPCPTTCPTGSPLNN